MVFVTAACAAAACGVFAARDGDPRGSPDASDGDTRADEAVDDAAADDAEAASPFCAPTPGIGDGTAPLSEVDCGGAKFQLRTNVQHCGACFHACGPASACTDGICTPETVVDGTHPSLLLGIAGGRMCWARALDSGTSDVVCANLDGGAQRVFFTTTDDGGAVYGGAMGTAGVVVGQGNGTLTLVDFDNDGGVARTPNVESLALFALTGRDVYFTTYSPGTLRHVPLGGGDATTLVNDSYAYAVAADGPAIYWSKFRGDDGLEAGSIARYERDGGAIARSLAATDLYAIGLDDDFVYHYGPGDAAYTIRRLLKSVAQAPSEALAMVTTFHDVAYAIAVDDAHVYLATGSSQNDPSNVTIIRVPKCGGAPVALARTSEAYGALGLDGAHLYWAEADGKIRRVRK